LQDFVGDREPEIADLADEPSSPAASRQHLAQPASALTLGQPAQQTSQASLEQGVKNLKGEMAACYLFGSLAPLVGQQIDNGAYRLYLAELLREAGNPSDPVERMLIEQLALAHHNAGRLLVKAASSQSLREASGYNASAARLMAEFRRSMLTLKKYRSLGFSTASADPAQLRTTTPPNSATPIPGSRGRQTSTAQGNGSSSLHPGGPEWNHPFGR
jgi:hypothetical protein